MADHDCNDPNHSHDNVDGIEFNLNRYIDTAQITCLNERTKGSARQLFRAWEERLDESKFVESDADPELIINIPFGALTQIRSIIVIGGGNDSAPNKMKAYLNKDNIDFGNINSITPIQEWQLHEDFEGQISYNTNTLTLYFPTSFGAPRTKIQYIALKGVYTNARREVVNTVYESRPQLSDHKGAADDLVGRANGY
ncbi:UPF0424 family protein [Cavenderia fasciculata]|uniref:UPF0424 family protein n=1 Tax=Cavenderia fasciculata TaxID=261658 RepID=F4QB60_CACFS|nr:UPF0424 family protein [Cavenderia fasciculata]EGG14832.1 UPF0424 family protein [Cavenderia fasciculata]|eukprot:XP_004351348.1 UPF0424 family protein [Cavenderia fasciculata]